MSNPTVIRARIVGAVGAIVGVLALASIVLGTFLLSPRELPTLALPAADTSWPRIVTEDELRSFGAMNGPVYWAGPQSNAQYELTITDSGTFFVRYLTDGAAVGDTTDRFLSVATYPNIDGYNNLVQAGAQDGATSTLTEGGALIVTTTGAPLSTYFSFEGLGFQVEVYSPDASASRSLVEDGTVEILK